jgi:hypothetical protein
MGHGVGTCGQVGQEAGISSMSAHPHGDLTVCRGLAVYEAWRPDVQALDQIAD